jgi:hypothetical protein
MQSKSHRQIKTGKTEGAYAYEKKSSSAKKRGNSEKKEINITGQISSAYACEIRRNNSLHVTDLIDPKQNRLNLKYLISQTHSDQ